MKNLRFLERGVYSLVALLGNKHSGPNVITVKNGKDYRLIFFSLLNEHANKISACDAPDELSPRELDRLLRLAKGTTTFMQKDENCHTPEPDIGNVRGLA
ncbi:unnamed protein product [Lactuca virosa]|uniref:Uncharacterized protein n=1 Tax=Lactuca virosa TaxID=75947 RepID=A0AAU9PSK8_9ASTR|nr:unnamed protein product [Lactuca virosa]